MAKRTKAKAIREPKEDGADVSMDPVLKMMKALVALFSEFI